MATTDKGHKANEAAAFSWWWDSRNRPHQSQWLQTTLTDLDEKKKSMLKILQDDSDSFARRAEIYFKNRPELVEMVEDLSKSYRYLAQKYDQLRSEFIREGQPRSFSSSNSFNQVQQRRQQQFEIYCKNIVENEEEEAPIAVESTETSSTVFESLNNNDSSKWSNGEVDTDESINKEVISKRVDDDTIIESNNGQLGDDDVQMLGLERENKWSEQSLKVLKLVEDNLREQEMLIRRNDEKREEIKQLYAQINRLRDKNRALKRCLANSKVDKKQNQTETSNFRKLLLGVKFKS